MKKVLKKAMAIVLSLSVMAAMLVTMTTVGMAAANSGEYVWIDDAAMVYDNSNTFSRLWVSGATDGRASVSWASNGVTANFTVSEGTYDIWYLGHANLSWTTVMNWTIDNGTANTTYAISNYSSNGSLSGDYPDVNWHKLNSQVYFEEGDHNIHLYSVSAPTTYRMVFDAIVVVPSEMLWTPSGLTKPAAGQVAGNYTYIEGANFSNADGHYVANDVAGSDRGYAAKFYNSSDATFVSTTINYDFMVDKTDEYDIWVLGSQSVAWLGQYNWKLDDAESYNAFGTVMRQPYTWSVQGSTQPVCVYKVASGESITAGKHNIEFELLKRTAGSGSFNLIDTIMVVPTSYNWTWTNGATVTAAMLSADQTTLSIGATEVTEDFTLPVYGQSGSKISWASSNEEIVSIEGGKCSLKDKRETDETVTLTATITRDGSSVTKSFDITVKKNVVGYVLGFDSGLTADTIKATAVYYPKGDETAEFEGIIAIYDKDNRVLNVSSSKSENNIAEMSIPNQKGVYKAKIFVWDKLSGLVPLAESLDLYNIEEYVDFAVTVEEDREPVVLQLTDTQIIDAAQTRTSGRLSSTQAEYWATDKLEDRCFGYIRETVEATNPDLILLTGDLVYGEFDDNGTSLTALIEFMESFDIPWAPVFGNHENESTMGADWQCQQLENAENCLFKQRTLTGNGNYSIGIVQGGMLKRVFFMLDSNGCGGMSEESLANGHSQTTAGFGSDQIAWYTEAAQKINKSYPDMKYTFAFHIQPIIFKTAYEKYGFTNSDTINNPINIDNIETAAETDFGYIGRDLKGPWDLDYTVYNGMKDLGADSILVGHEHCNSASVVYDGIRFQFGQKSSTYDRANYIQSDGTIVGSYDDVGEPVMGGTVMKLSQTDGAITDAYIYYCDTAEDGIDSDIDVNGINFDTGELYTDSNIAVKATTFGGVNTYEFTANAQGKVYISKELVANKNTFTFSVFMPETATNKLAGYGEFAIRIKPNNIEPSIDGTADGYIKFSSSATDDKLKLVFGEWKTYTVDISDLGSSCTEFAFNIAAGNTIYVKDIEIL